VRGDDHQGDGLSREMTGGTARAGGVGKSRALPGGSPTGAASRRLAAVPASRGPDVARRRYALTGTGLARKERLTGRSRAVRVQQWTAVAGPHGARVGTKRRRPRKARKGVVAGGKANSLVRSSGQGRGRTADLPLSEGLRVQADPITGRLTRPGVALAPFGIRSRANPTCHSLWPR